MSIGRKPVINRQHPDRFHKNSLQKIEALKGEGHYIYRNSSKSTLLLMKPAFDGRKEIPPGDTWEGDSYFIGLVKMGDARLVEQIKTPESEQNMLNEETLILDQPDTITTAGKVEHVVEEDGLEISHKISLKNKKKKINEQPTEEGVLLTEDPLEGIQILG